jgi:hypothetical protein
MSNSRVIDGRQALGRYPGAPPYDDLEPWRALRRQQVALWDDLGSVLPRS